MYTQFRNCIVVLGLSPRGYVLYWLDWEDADWSCLRLVWICVHHGGGAFDLTTISYHAHNLFTRAVPTYSKSSKDALQAIMEDEDDCDHEDCYHAECIDSSGQHEDTGSRCANCGGETLWQYCPYGLYLGCSSRTRGEDCRYYPWRKGDTHPDPDLWAQTINIKHLSIYEHTSSLKTASNGAIQ